MPCPRVPSVTRLPLFLLVLLLLAPPAVALDKPTGAPLELSSIETEQGVPLAVLSPDGKTASCVIVRLHWNPQPSLGPDDDAAAFTVDLPPGSPGASIFTAQLWNASLASALAWQQPWEGARWKILDTPSTDGTGIDAALAVGLISTSARRPYPKDTLVIGSLKPDGTLGAVTQPAARLDAAAAAGITRVIIPSVQRFDVDDSGQVLNLVRHAEDLHLQCVPVDNLVQATEEVMHDPLPPVILNGATPKYGNEVSGYIDDFARREQTEMTDGLSYAPKEEELGKYPARIAAIWKAIHADNEFAQQAYRAGQVYTAYRLFAHANGLMHGVNALTGQNGLTFDVQAALSESEDLRRRVRELIDPPAIDQGELESALLVAEMADWAYDISAALEGAQLVTRQAFSTRTDATAAEKDRAREAILFANAQARYLLDGAAFYSGLLPHVTAHPLSVDANAAHLLPQLIPAQLAMAQIFTEGIRSHANELRDGLLFDPRLVAYINVLRATKTAWEAGQHKKQLASPAPAPDAPPAATKLNTTTTESVGFDPGGTYFPPQNQIIPTAATKKLSDAAACLIWADHDCEIAALDEKYLHLVGTVDPVTHEWHIKDRAKLDALLQSAEGGARLGITFAENAEVDTSVLAMIYERASQLRLQPDDASGLDALRNYWRCALLGNMCWQLAHTRKAEPVEIATKGDKTKDKGDQAKPGDKKDSTAASGKPSTPPKNETASASSGATNSTQPAAPAVTNTDHLVITPPPEPETEPAPTPAPPVAVVPIVPVALPATNTPGDSAPPRALPVDPATESTTGNAAPPRALPVEPAPETNAAPAASPPSGPVVMPAASVPPVAIPADEASIPVAPVARTEDYTGPQNPVPLSTNAPTAGVSAPPTTNKPSGTD